MKKLILFLIAAAGVLTLHATEPLRQAASKIEKRDGGSAITFDGDDHNYGIIRERGGKRSHTYTFTNTGDRPLVITRVVTSCKCVDSDFSRRPVAPGAKGSITVTYNPRKQEGVFYKAIQVYTNTPEQRHVIIARGEVVP